MTPIPKAWRSADRLSRSVLPCDIVRNHRLATVVLVAVAVTRVDHQPAGKIGGVERVQRCFDTGGIVIRTSAAAAQDDMRVTIAACFDDGRQALFGDAHEMVRP